MVFDSLRQSLEELINRGTRPEDRRQVAAQMRDTLVQARVGLGQLRDALAATSSRLATERDTVATMQRRRELAARIADTETVALAEKHERLHAARVEALERQVAAQEAELVIAEGEVESMTRELRMAMAGGMAAPSVSASDGGGDAGGSDAGGSDAGGSDAGAGDPLDDAAALSAELDALGRARARAERQADADRRLDELKRRMGR
jgi:hypothetical protein